ncbi:hypothetical protein SEEACDC4_11067 [Salmonella enterica subsp. enterica serovar Agona str. SA-4]|nr:hypothetical protein SEEACDC4_11067 [Salmonella enterica subsp. enterica serovar Agona str. SA-4]
MSQAFLARASFPKPSSDNPYAKDTAIVFFRQSVALSTVVPV